MVIRSGTGYSLSDQSVAVREGLSIQCDARTLISMVFDAVQQVEWPLRKTSLMAGAVPDPVLRTVLTYCYAVGIVSSEDIASAAVHDGNVRYLCANHLPGWEEVREFRRRSFPFLTRSLSLLFRAALGNASEPKSDWLRPLFVDPLHEAEKRLAHAIQADSAAMDD